MQLRFRMVLVLWITVIHFNKIDSAQASILQQPNPVITAKAGEKVTLHCFFLREQTIDPIVWYKQAGGREPSLVAVVQNVQDPIYKDEFNSSRFRIEKGSESCHLTIMNVNPSDEAMYYCGLVTFLTTFAKGTFLSVKDKAELKVSVFQSRVSDSVPAGASVTLQCSVLSESRAAELQVLWFRAAPPQSHPQIIYTHHNSSHQCESGSSTHTCVYNFSKNILSLSDTGTYYCAVAVCGKIILGNGTRVQQENCATAYDPIAMYLGTALVICVILTFIQAVLLCKRKNGQQNKKIRHNAVIHTEQTNTQSHDAAELNYAAVHFSERKTKKVRENRDRSQNSVYSIPK